MMNEISNLRQELLKEFKEKSLQDRKHFTDILKRETESQILSMYEANREVFRRIEIDMNELRELIEASKHPNEASFISSQRKFLDPKMIKYKEVIERGEQNTRSDAVVIN